MLLSHIELQEIVAAGVIRGVVPSAINAASIDVRLGSTLLVEAYPQCGGARVVDLSKRDPIALNRIDMDEEGFVIHPGQFVLAHTIETFHLPDDISMQFLLKSSPARNGLEHAAATWCDAGWHSSSLTLELRNVTQYHPLLVRPGMFVGQMKAFRHTPVPPEQSYRARGRYNGDAGVSAIKP